MKKEIKELIKEKANNIYEKYYSNNPDFPLNEKTTLINEISFILKKTLITTKRKKYLNKTYILPATDIFGPDSNIFFSPDFEESLKYLSPFYALSFFKTSYLDNVNDIYNLEHIIYQRDNGLIPYFTIKELSRLYKDFALFIEDNSESLIETGWPDYNFTDSTWLFFSLSQNYPIEIPFYIKNLNRLKNPSGDPYFVLKKYFLNKTNQSKKCKYKMVSLLKKFSYKELGFIEDMRYKFLCLKKTILNEINQYLFLDTTDKDIWFKNCVKIFFSNLSKKDFQNIECIEKKYDEIKFYNYKINGGLTNLMDHIVFLYQESKYRRMPLDKSTMNSILKGSKFNYQRRIISYYQLAQFVQDDYENKRYNKMINKSINELNKIEEEVKKNKQFMYDTLKSSKEECLKVDYLLKPKYYPFVDNLIKSFEKGEGFKIGIPFLSQLPTPSKKRITPLKLPSDTKWEHITIQFLDYDKVRIKAPNYFNKIVNFREMGFENKKNNKPNKQWEFLYQLAQCRGDLTWTIASYRKRVDTHPLSTPKARKWKQRLSDTLKDFFSIDGDPFYNYKSQKAYKTKFFLLPEPSNMKNLL